MQLPFENPKALSFCAHLKNHFKIPDENCICVGDETDQYFAGLYKRSPDADHTANTEIASANYRLEQWYAAFPKMKVCISNHATRWAKKAFEADIPEQVLRPYRELIKAPDGWQWAKYWDIETANRFRVIHGMGYSGMNGHRTAALDLGLSVVMGHLHAHAGTATIQVEGSKRWGMNVGCLIEPEAYAFHYGKDCRFKPTLGTGVVLDNGRVPFWIPL